MVSSFIETEETRRSIPLMCRVLRVSRPGYYAWRERPPSSREREDAELTGRIGRIHRDSRGTYGAPRVHAQLRSEGVRVGNKRVARLMRKEGLQGCHHRCRKTPRTTLRDPRATPAEDLVERDFTPVAKDRLWVADVPYVPTWGGFDYLAFILDAYSGRLVGWAMADHLRAGLVTDALGMAVWRRNPAPGLDAPWRPGKPVHLDLAGPEARGGWNRALHGLGCRSLRQRLGRIVRFELEAGTRGEEIMAHQGGGEGRDVRILRGLLQSQANPLRPGMPESGGLREEYNGRRRRCVAKTCPLN